MPRALWWSEGGGVVSYERGNPVNRLLPSPEVALLGARERETTGCELFEVLMAGLLLEFLGIRPM